MRRKRQCRRQCRFAKLFSEKILILNKSSAVAEMAAQCTNQLDGVGQFSWNLTEKRTSTVMNGTIHIMPKNDNLLAHFCRRRFGSSFFFFVFLLARQPSGDDEVEIRCLIVQLHLPLKRRAYRFGWNDRSTSRSFKVNTWYQSKGRMQLSC